MPGAIAQEVIDVLAVLNTLRVPAPRMDLNDVEPKSLLNPSVTKDTKRGDTRGSRRRTAWLLCR